MQFNVSKKKIIYFHVAYKAQREFLKSNYIDKELLVFVLKAFNRFLGLFIKFACMNFCGTFDATLACTIDSLPM